VPLTEFLASPRRPRTLAAGRNIVPAHPSDRLSALEHCRLDELRRLARLMDLQWGIGPIRYRLAAGPDPRPGRRHVGRRWPVALGVAARLGVPRGTLLRMAVNLGLDLALGLVPSLGDVGDLLFKAHACNLRLIEEHVRGREHRAALADGR
jgi:hypothetical protein